MVKHTARVTPACLRALLLLLSLLSCPALAAISASVERTVINEGDTIVLNVKQTGQTSQRPDFKPLEYDFEILRRSQSSQTRIINFKTEHWLEWSLVLAPRRTGTLVIPSIRAGREASSPITVEIRRGAGPASTANRDVFVDVEADLQRAWVQGQVLLTVRVFHKGRLDGTLTDPEIEHAIIESLGDQRKYETIQQGIRYKVIERRFAIFPQRSGTLLVPAVTLSGTIDTARSSIFGFNTFGPSQGRTVHVRSRPLEIEVLPKPDDWPDGETWLPAAELSLSEEWSPDTYRLEVGEAITRTLRIRAEGLAASQLPIPETSWPASVKTYPEAPERKDEAGFDGITGTATFATAVIPTEGGIVSAPEIRMTWWNTRLKRREVAVIPARRFEIAGGAATRNQPAPAPQPEPSRNQSISPESVSPDLAKPEITESGTTWGWVLVSGFLLSGWLVTAFLWWKQRNHAPPAPMESSVQATGFSTDTRKALQRLRKACRDNQPSPARAALLDWARTHFRLAADSSLEQVLGKIQTPSLRNAALELDDYLYRKQETGGRSWNGAILLEAAEQEIRVSGKENSQNRKDLPSLYSV